MQRAKIIATLGPASSSVEILVELLKAGMDVARLNMSHGDHPTHEAALANLRTACEITGSDVSVFIDLQGPKIRLGKFGQGPVTLVKDARFTITTDSIIGDEHRCSTTHKGFPGDVSVGDTVLIDDGRVVLQVVGVSESDVNCEVITGGVVSNAKGINLPGVAVSVPALSEKDEQDLRWGISHGVDMVALSFVRTAEDVLPIRRVMDEIGVTLPIIAKIEKPQALEHLDGIIKAFDAFMVARGDLGVELPFEDVPMAQKRIIHAARLASKPVIVATQMLESMITAARPTRAEASDVANAVMDGADAVMLSGETSIGSCPIEAVDAMERIIRAVESHSNLQIDSIAWDPHTTAGALTWSAVGIARQLGARYIVGFSLSGDTARRLSRLRAEIPILCFTPRERTKKALGIVWGLEVFVSESHDMESMIEEMDAILQAKGLAQTGDRVVVVYGTPMGVAGKTNTVYVHRVRPPL
ncbi:MAG: pyruvate kinase [Propionibacteriaceae bacterium]|nr:pyruvate kinase [Propionibacteriaceae bacterium]